MQDSWFDSSLLMEGKQRRGSGEFTPPLTICTCIPGSIYISPDKFTPPWIFATPPLWKIPKKYILRMQGNSWLLLYFAMLQFHLLLDDFLSKMLIVSSLLEIYFRWLTSSFSSCLMQPRNVLSAVDIWATTSKVRAPFNYRVVWEDGYS